MTRAIVFDLDGTLVDATPDIAAALSVAVGPLGAGPVTPEQVEPLLGSGPRSLVLGCLRLLGLPEDADQVESVMRAYTAAYVAAPAARTQPIDTAATVLRTLSESGARLGVCTNKRTAIAEEVLRHLGMLEFLTAVVGSDAMPYPKPDPRHLLHTLTLLDADPAEALYVGDTLVDAQTARAAGVRYAHVAWGRDGVEADLVLGTFDDLIAI